MYFDIEGFKQAVYDETVEVGGLRELSRRTGIPPSNLSRWANGKIPELEQFIRFCRLCDLEPTLFFFK